MPLMCLRRGEEFYAGNVSSSAAWENLRQENLATRSLSCRFCDSLFHLRTSPLGTRHFVHVRQERCTSAPESHAHLLAKERIAAGVSELSLNFGDGLAGQAAAV